MLARLKSGLKSRASLIIDGLEIGVLVLGSGVAVAFGKFLAALVFAVLAAGIACRFFRRRPVNSEPSVRLYWVSLVSGGLSIVGTAIVVEAVNLPVRFDQAGFEKSNWLMIIATILVFYWMLRAIFTSVSTRRVTGTEVANHE